MNLKSIQFIDEIWPFHPNLAQVASITVDLAKSLPIFKFLLVLILGR